MKFKENKLIGGGGNRLASHINSFGAILMRCLDAKMRRGKVCYDKSSLRANAKQSSEIVITRSEKRRSNLIHIENNEIATATLCSASQ